MTDQDFFDPAPGNVLTRPLGPILSREEAFKRLAYLPPKPKQVSTIPKHLRLHKLLEIRDLHVPSHESGRVVQTVDMMVREGYRYRDPAQATTWAQVSQEQTSALRPRPPAMAAVVVGHSGVGKTVAIQKAFDCYPSQVIVHDSFPRLKGPHFQMVYLSIGVPWGGRLVDLATELMLQWDEAVARVLPDAPRRFAAALTRNRQDGNKMMSEWRQVAAAHFLGCLHLDEIQNFFRLPSLEARRAGKTSRSKASGSNDSGQPELRIVDDQALKMVLTLSNTSTIPLITSGTPDGVGAMMRRLSNAERMASSGYHKLGEFAGPSDAFFEKFMQTLGAYQYVAKPIPIDGPLLQRVYELTAGIPRIIVALWIAAQRVALEGKDDVLTLDNFEQAAKSFLAPVAPAVAALISKDPVRMRRYEDLLPRDDDFWAMFYGGAGSI